jgi:hypothetical protein
MREKLMKNGHLPPEPRSKDVSLVVVDEYPFWFPVVALVFGLCLTVFDSVWSAC